MASKAHRSSLRHVLLFFEIKALAEALHSASAVENALLPGKEGMAVRADIYSEILLNTGCREGVAARAGHGCLSKFGVNSRFHRVSMYPFYSMPLYYRHADQGMNGIQQERRIPLHYITSCQEWRVKYTRFYGLLFASPSYSRLYYSETGYKARKKVCPKNRSKR